MRASGDSSDVQRPPLAYSVSSQSCLGTNGSLFARVTANHYSKNRRTTHTHKHTHTQVPRYRSDVTKKRAKTVMDVRPCLTRSHMKRGGHAGRTHTWTILFKGRCCVRSISARCSTGRILRQTDTHKTDQKTRSTTVVNHTHTRTEGLDTWPTHSPVRRRDRHTHLQTSHLL